MDNQIRPRMCKSSRKFTQSQRKQRKTGSQERLQRRGWSAAPEEGLGACQLEGKGRSMATEHGWSVVGMGSRGSEGAELDRPRRRTESQCQERRRGRCH